MNPLTVAKHFSARILSREDRNYQKHYTALGPLNFEELKKVPNNFFSNLYDELFSERVSWRDEYLENYGQLTNNFFWTLFTDGERLYKTLEDMNTEFPSFLANEQTSVRHMQQNIDNLTPVIILEINDKQLLIDGWHTALACHKEQKPLHAYIGKMDSFSLSHRYMKQYIEQFNKNNLKYAVTGDYANYFKTGAKINNHRIEIEVESLQEAKKVLPKEYKIEKETSNELWAHYRLQLRLTENKDIQSSAKRIEDFYIELKDE